MSETTEWEDIHIRLGNMAPKPKTRLTDKEIAELVEEAIVEHEQEEKEKLEKASLDKLEEIEDELDEKVFEEYRKKRLAEMKQQALNNKFGDLYEISETEYKTAVTLASNECYIVVLLYKFGLPHCEILLQKLPILASKFKSTKFVRIRSTEAIKNYPDKNLPTILVYRNTDVVGQFVGLSSFAGESTNEKDIEWALKQLGAIESNMEENPRKDKTSVQSKGLSSRKNDSDDDDD